MTMSRASLSSAICAMRSTSARLSWGVRRELPSWGRWTVPRVSGWIDRFCELVAVETLGLDQLAHGVRDEVADRTPLADALTDERGGDPDLRHLDPVEVGGVDARDVRPRSQRRGEPRQ